MCIRDMDWDYTLAGLSHINRESIDAIRTAVWAVSYTHLDVYKRQVYRSSEMGIDALDRIYRVFYALFFHNT